MNFTVPCLAVALLIATNAPSLAENITVNQEGKKFSEAEVTINVGDIVTFVNKDPVTHNVYSATTGMGFDLKQQKPGETTTISFDQVGEATVQCAIHPLMKMKINVR